MTGLRRALGRVAVVWLLCQTATMTLAPMLLLSGSAHAELLECTCEHGDHAICPMHHKPAAPDSKLCFLRSADPGGIAALSWLFNGVGLLPAPAPEITPVAQHIRVRVDVTTASRRPIPPDPPPPRG
jgi:hypothetical protein